MIRMLKLKHTHTHNFYKLGKCRQVTLFAEMELKIFTEI